MIVEDVMSRRVITVQETSSVGEALELLSTAEVRHLPVVSASGEVTGILSDRDLRALGTHIVTDLETMEIVKERLRAPVTTLMSSDVIAIDPDADVRDVVDLMVEEKVGAVPVIDSETNELVGIVSYIDVLRSTREFLD